MKKLLFIVNPKAGKMVIKNHVMDIASECRKSGFEITFCPTLARGEAVDIVAEKGADYDLIVCAGGDGTLDEVVTGTQIGQMDVPIGYIPAGSTNDYAKSLQLPVTIESAAKLIMRGKPRPVDVGAFNDQFFIYCAAFGSLADVSYSTDQDMKNMFGHLAYVVDGAISLANLKSYKMTITVDGVTMTDEFIHGMITNSVSVGGFKSIVSDQTKLDDGLFEVLLVKKPKDAADLTRILSAYLLGDTSVPEIVFLQTSQISFLSDEPVAWSLDGEFGGAHKESYIENKKQRIRIMRK